ncbi:MAG: glycosyltransferase family protein, partial [Acidimicrobiales bacterium]
LHVAYVHEGESASTFRYRVFNMVESLHSGGTRRASAGWFTRPEYQQDISFVDVADVLVICRSRLEDGLTRVIERARQRGIPVVYDIDDLIIDVNIVDLLIETMGWPAAEDTWDFWYAYVARHQAVLALCDAATVATTALGDHVRLLYPDKPCAVIPNYMNDAQVKASDQALETKRSLGFARKGKVTMAYLSGSNSHNRDLLVASPGIAAALRRHRDLQLRIVGMADVNEHLRGVEKRIETMPLQDFLNLQRVTAQCEFSLTPLQDNIFTRCKSALKYFETAAVGCPTIASPLPELVSGIAPPEHGRISGAEEWEQRIEELYDLARSNDPDFNRMAGDAAVDSRHRFGPGGRADQILDALAELTGVEC